MSNQFPPYISRSADYNSGLPYSFIGARYFNFILKGEIGKLQNLCDVYINRPSEFKVNVSPLAPYVILTFAHYPKAYSQALNPAEYGFMQYDEAVFTMVVQTEKGICGLRRETMSFIPYLFLDNPRAIVAGREVFSLPKVHGIVNIPNKEDWGNPNQFDCNVRTLPSLGPLAQARNMQLVQVTAPKGFVCRGTKASGANTWNQIDSHVYSSFGESSSVSQSQSKSLTRAMQLKFINLRQFRGFPDTKIAAQKSIFGYQATNVSFADGGTLIGDFEITFPETAPMFPLVESLGLMPRIISAFWYEWTFQFQLGKDIWNTGMAACVRS